MEQPSGHINSQAYLKTKVMTASPEQLQLMLYDGAICFCEKARPAIETGQVEKSYQLISRAEKIVLEMCNSLRDEVSPEICARMRALYLYCYEKLVEANIQKMAPPLEEALKTLRYMRETWLMLIEKVQSDQQENRHDPSLVSTEQPPSPQPLGGSNSSSQKLQQTAPGSVICIEG